ncbi:MAG: glycosyltransferase family 2 protein [Microbacteriaceae bacterium]|jgi:GT2 family glycosyltransferase|nr:glycosyltransferase family 2 protein [Microbacteriaceae bacterium]
MQPRVTAILVARNGADYLQRTLSALHGQTRTPDVTVLTDDSSTDGSAAMLAAADATIFVPSAGGAAGFGAAVARALAALDASADPGAAADTDSWLWLLGHDNAPAPTALAALLAAVEIAPSVAVAGPKLMRWNTGDVIESYGETLTRLGASVSLVSGELDQAQHDRHNDMLGLAAGGMLVRRSAWDAIGGFDPALPAVDAALDFCVRVRLAGHRVVGVPDARVSSAGAAEDFGRPPVTLRAANGLHRRAQLHRRLVYAPIVAVPFHWLSLVPLAFVRTIWHLLGKRPGLIASEFSAAFLAALDGGVLPARRALRRSRVLGWAAIAPLRMPPRDVRELRATQRAILAAPDAGAAQGSEVGRASFFSDGGAWIVLLAATVGAVAFGPLFGAAAVTGGALLPVSTGFRELWANVGYGWHDIGGGFVGAADPFAFVVAILGTLTFWAPSQSIVVLYFAALPLAALGAWWCAARFSERGWAPGVAAVLWAFAPPFLAALNGGHLGAVIAHLLLPWIVVTLVNAARSWSASAACSLLFAATIAAAPSLAPALLLGWLAWMIARPRSIHRLFGIVIPALVLFAPLVVQQVLRSNALGLAADPGAPVVAGTASGWQLALGSPLNGYSGWSDIASAFGWHDLAAPVIVAALLAPLAVLALLALFLPGSRRAIPAMVVALAGFATAVVAAHVQVAHVGIATAPLWPGNGLSLFWLGLIGAAVVALEVLGRAVIVPALLVAATTMVLAGPLLAAPISGDSAIRASTGRMLPAFVSAEAAGNPALGTLVLTAQPDGSLAANLQRGEGTTLDAQSTLASTNPRPTDAQQRLATLAGNLASKSGFDTVAELQELQIGFVLAPKTSGEEAVQTRKRATEALDGNASLTAIGETATGFLWRLGALEPGAAPTGPGPLGSPLGVIVTLAQSIVLIGALLLAVPTGGRRRRRTTPHGPSEPAPTFEEDDGV